MALNRIEIRRLKRVLRKDNPTFPRRLECIPEHLWPRDPHPGGRRRIGLWRSRHFLVQAFEEPAGVVRLSINRTEIRDDGEWRDDISWDTLQDLKRQAGYGDCFAVEVFPADQDIVNVSNMRHLWVMPAPMPFCWRAPGGPGE